MIRFLYFIAALLGLIVLAWSVIVDEHAYGESPSHRLDVYSMPNAENAPIILMLHGGSWSSGSKRWPDVWFAKAKHWLPKGYIFVSARTRLLPEADQLDQAEDFAAALAYVQKNAHEWGGDKDRVILMGHSSGGHIASLVATRQELLERVGAIAPVGAIMLDTSVIDIEVTMAKSPSGFLRRFFGSDKALWRAASPSTYMDPADPPLLFACATNRAWPCQSARAFAAMASQVSVLPVDRDHRGVNASLGRPGDYTDAVDLWLRERGLP